MTIGRYNITSASQPTPFVWFRVAKTGTRTVLKVLRENSVVFEVEQGFHLPLLGYEYLGYFSFTFVRNPYNRLVSGWTNKVINGGTGGGLMRVKSPERLRNFNYFVDWLIDQDPAEINIHYRPQTLLVPERVDFIGRTESLASDLRFVLSRIGLDVDQDIPKENESGPPPLLLQDVSGRTLDTIHSLYRNDFERFGYPMLA